MTVSTLKQDPRKQVPYFSVSVDTSVEVDIDPDELHDAGWHHENECAGGRKDGKDGKDGKGLPPVTIDDGWTTITNALESLHGQAHGRGDIAVCREEPCVSLSLRQLRGAA